MASSNPTRPRPDDQQRPGQSSLPHEDGPWDAESAEALTRAYEESEAEWRESRAARRPPNDRGQDHGQTHSQAHSEAAPADAAASAGSAWLESRVAEIAERLQRSIAGIDPDKSAGALGHRIDELEHRLSTAFQDVARRLDGQSLGNQSVGNQSLEGIGAQIGGLAAHLEHTRGQLERLDAIDERLRDLAGRLDEHQRLPEPARLNDSAIEALIEAAADRAATRMVQSLPPAAPGIDPQRIDALEELMQDQIAERRQAEEMTSSVLRTIEEALGRILDRVDAMEPRPDSPDAAAPADAKSLVDPLLEAYAQGARALGQATPASLLDASDYATNAPYTAAAAPDKLALPDWDEQADEDAQTRHEQRSSAIRAKLKSQAMSADADQGTDQGEDATGAPDTLDPGTASSVRARVKPFAATSGRRSSLLLTVAMAVLFAAGYLGVDYFLAQSQIPTARMQQARLSSPDVRATPAVASSKDAAAFNREPYDGARPDGATGMLPEAIGTARLRQAAVNGDPLAQYEVASRFADGRGVAQDQTQAFAWYLRAAMHGFVPAQFRVAGLFERGLGVTADAERSKVWYRRAAEQGHVKAMHNLAVLSASRDANRGDFATAAEWFQQAAERGLTDSQYNLGLLYQKGLGVTKNLPASYLWFALAARGGDKEAAVRLEQVRAQMEPGALAAAEQQVADWRARSSPIGAGPEPAAAPADDDAEVGG